MTRIIAGHAKGRRLSTPAHARTRPTSDRVREALFSALVSWLGTSDEPATGTLDGISFLDLYGGSGAVGLEAASRGAFRVVIVEKDAATARLAVDNVRTSGLQARVITAKAATYVGSPGNRFDIVFLDPPYDMPTGEVDTVVRDMLANDLLARDGLVVVERSSRDLAPQWPEVLGEHWSRRYGETTLHFATAEEESR